MCVIILVANVYMQNKKVSVPVARYKFASNTRSHIFAKSIIAAYYKSRYLLKVFLAPVK